MGEIAPPNDAVLIRCGICGGKKRWIALDYHTMRDAKRWMWKAAITGDWIDTGSMSTTGQANPVCKCPEKAEAINE